MNIVGDKDKFAFAYSMDAQRGGEWLFGKCCYFIAGQEVGDYSLGTSLRDVYTQMTSIVKDNGNRSDPRLCTFDETSIFKLLRFRLYEDVYDDISSIASFVETPARFDVRIPVDVFDCCSIFLLDCEDEARLIYSLDDQKVSVVSLQLGEFDRIIASAFDQLGKAYNLATKGIEPAK